METENSIIPNEEERFGWSKNLKG